MIAIPKGTKDILPSESYKWHFIENVIGQITKQFGFKEIRTPVFEHTELFLRGVGETTDIVNKEMYTFNDKGNRSLTLKPEGTAGVARAYISGGLESAPQPNKMYYITPVFRYERPQSGRLREHHQFGVELYGSDSPYADAEVILVAKTLFEKLGIQNVQLNINSIGCKVCRTQYNEALRAFFANQIEKMCPVCQERLDKNPLRILDCKEANCAEICKNAPKILDYLCDDCVAHHEQLQDILTSLNVKFKVNPNIVRGLDYYTRTVFEFISTSIGAQGTVCGGGRYNNLVEAVGGKPTPAVGFGMGLERLIMVAENTDVALGRDEIPLLYIAPLGEEQRIAAYKLTAELRKEGISVDTDFMNKSLKAQMKYADKIHYKFVVVLGENEVQLSKVNLKNMEDGTVEQIATECLAERLRSL